ncbi:hypothetical protein [Microbacterium azadirachtae]|uniref:Uridine kinase n=1 Tax=Microbacterium azadirachtae TaxID=582680 RepID=A0A1I6G8J1_9MICO|nr:hypothetical protein [Microbacterium azadirachtae]SDL37593.1 Uridine kinase [Microbacterium azadirachtae]SEF68529.1 Uridine kinase [Microbacterium azadirachtae]SEF69215.1 Uridine kinase [Microbacterium azadirachtae]SFR38516.1 Uridine kinase [Microbacterium azadirachtae]
MRVDHLPARGTWQTLLIDGRSGAGKSTLASAVAVTVPGCVVVHLDDIYPGWDGLEWAHQHIITSLLEPRSRSTSGTWRQWDWASNAPSGWRTVPANVPLIVEGVGSLSPRTRNLADLGIWVEAPDTDRKHRALARDGDTYAPHWERWAAHEESFQTMHHPRDTADFIARAISGGLHISPAGATT